MDFGLRLPSLLHKFTSLKLKEIYMDFQGRGFSGICNCICFKWCFIITTLVRDALWPTNCYSWVKADANGSEEEWKAAIPWK